MREAHHSRRAIELDGGKDSNREKITYIGSDRHMAYAREKTGIKNVRKENYLPRDMETLVERCNRLIQKQYFLIL